VSKGSRPAPGPVSRALAEILRDAWLELLITQTKFGELLGGVPQSTISQYLNGGMTVDPDTLVKMCRVLSIDPVAAFAIAVELANRE